jgi:hypothetical protein
MVKNPSSYEFLMYIHVMKKFQEVIEHRVLWEQTYQETVNGTTTLSPTFKVLTSPPISETVPVNSWPMMKPVGDG